MAMDVKQLSKSFHKNGFISGVDILTVDETKQLFSNYLKYENAVKKDDVIPADFRFELHLLTSWANQIIRHPKILFLVSEILCTDNIVVWSTDLNLKREKSEGFFSWHQDSLYAGFSPPEKFITVWLAITPSNKENGCVCFLPKTHHKQLPHIATSTKNNMLSLGQTISDRNFIERNISNIYHAELNAGQISVHSSLAVHASGPNNSDDKRVGLAIRYVAENVKRIKGCHKQPVTLVQGQCSNECFQCLDEICEDFSETALKNHKNVIKIAKEIYFAEIDGKYKDQ